MERLRKINGFLERTSLNRQWFVNAFYGNHWPIQGSGGNLPEKCTLPRSGDTAVYIPASIILEEIDPTNRVEGGPTNTVIGFEANKCRTCNWNTRKKCTYNQGYTNHLALVEKPQQQTTPRELYKGIYHIAGSVIRLVPTVVSALNQEQDNLGHIKVPSACRIPGKQNVTSEVVYVDKTIGQAEIFIQDPVQDNSDLDTITIGLNTSHCKNCPLKDDCEPYQGYYTYYTLNPNVKKTKAQPTSPNNGKQNSAEKAGHRYGNWGSWFSGWRHRNKL